MRHARRALMLAAAAAAPLVVASAAPAQVALYWDGNGVGPVGGGSGTWNTTLTRWSLTPDGTTFQAWVNANNDDAVFTGTAGSVSVPGALSARSLDFQVGGYTLTGVGPLTLAGSTAGTINTATGVTTMGVPLAGADGFTKSGAGTMVLSANSTATGNRRITGGAINIDSSLRFASSGTITLDGGMLVQTIAGSGGSYIPTGVALDVGANAGTVSYTGAATSSSIYAGTIRGPGTLHKTGTGEFRYQGTGLPNTSFSKLVVKEGLFRLGFANSTQDERGFGAVPASPTDDAITLDGGAIGTSFVATLHVNRGFTIGSGGGTINTSTGAMTIPGKITGSAGSTGLVFNSGNTANALTLSGANDFGNGFTLQVGRVNVQSNNALGTGDLVFAVTGNGTLVNNSGVDVTLNNPLVNLQSGSIDISANSGRTLTLTGKLTGPANWKKDNAGSAGTLLLSNSTSDFTGNLNVVSSRLVITANNALGSPAGATTIGNNAMLLMRGGFNYTTPEPLTVIGSGAANTGVIQNVADSNRFAGPVTMTGTSTVGVSAGELELAGPVGGAFRLAKVGPGALALSNAGNSFAALSVNEGTVVVGDDAHLGAAPASPAPINIILAGGALRASSSFTLNANRGINLVGNASAIDVAPGATLSYPGLIAGATLNKAGGGTLQFSTATAHTGGTNISGGTVSLIAKGSLSSDVNVMPGGALRGGGTVGGNVTVAGTVAPGHGPGTLATTGDHTWAGGGAYEFEIDDATGTAGANWDQMTMNAVTVSATSSNRFVIRVVALPGAGGPGLDNFNPDQPFAWAIAVATSGTVTGFDLEAFEIDVTQFEQNNQNKGGFYVSRGFKGDLMLNYVPEPGVGMLLTLGAAAGLLRRRRA